MGYTPVVAGYRTDADLTKMKFLVLALCVCAANAASFGNFGRQPYPASQPQQVAKAVAYTGSTPVAAAPAAIAAAPAAAANAAYVAAQAVADAPAVAAKAAYGAAKQTYVAGNDAEASILRSESDINADGFNYYFETGNGIAAQASGITKKVGNEEVVAFQGSYKYIADDGKEVVVNYVADENGYQPQSELLPVGPAIPEAILRSLEYIRAHYKPENEPQYQ